MSKLWNENSRLLLGICRATRTWNFDAVICFVNFQYASSTHSSYAVMLSSALSSSSIHNALTAAAAYAASTSLSNLMRSDFLLFVCLSFCFSPPLFLLMHISWFRVSIWIFRNFLKHMKAFYRTHVSEVCGFVCCFRLRNQVLVGKTLTNR